MTRFVQITITLDVEVDAAFVNDGWELHENQIERITYGKGVLDISHETLADFLINERADELLELYIQQEP